MTGAERTCLSIGGADVEPGLRAAGWRIVGEPSAKHDAAVAPLAGLADARRRTAAPLLALSARGDDSAARARAFAAGADDVAPFPCEAAELSARLLALLRRVPAIRCADLSIDPLTRSAARGGRAIPLLPREYALLHHLADAGGAPVSRMALLDRVWNLGFDPRTNVVEVHVSRLRAKLDRGFHPPLVHTVKGRGYALAEHPPPG